MVFKKLYSYYKRFMGEEVQILTEYEEITGRRVVYVNNPEEMKAMGYPNNQITNTKYTIWNFVIKTLVEQFSRRIHQYFLLLACLQLWGEITPVHPLSTWIPLIFIVSVGATKELIDDYFRMKADNQANRRPVTVIRGGIEQVVPSREIRVGEIVKVEQDEELPCDICILKSSDPKGVAYIETSNLDGETTLKTRKAIKETREMTQQEIFLFRGCIECAPPNDQIYKFDSSIQLREHHDSPKYPLTEEQLLPQGSYLKDTKWVYGIAVYTGNQTKLGQNKHVPYIKWTNADQFINNATTCIFIIQLCIMLSMGITGNIWRYTKQNNWWYLAYARDSTWYQPIVIPLRFLLLCSLMVPISLKVTVDICKYWYALFINWDLKMYDEKTNTPARAANTSISEDLGQIEYIFTDKTGTLTENVMIFKRCSVNGRAYGTKFDEPDPLLKNAIQENKPDIVEFFVNIVLNNAVYPTEEIEGKKQWKGVSPDEIALIKGARLLGIDLINRDDENNTVEISVDGKLKTYRVLCNLEFSSERKKSSILIKDEETGNIQLFTKGADDAIFESLKKGQEEIQKATDEHLDEFSKEGLRTLCIAKRSISEDEANEFLSNYKKANLKLHNRREALDAVFSSIEKDLELLGATAIEDKLQENVPETIQVLKDAGIVIWMLTGDKLQTAIQIGISCNLISKDAEKLIIKGKTTDEVFQSLRECLIKAKSIKDKPYSVIIEGPTFQMLLVKHLQMFHALCSKASSVICCRTSPKQKALIVRLMKGRGRNAKTVLAIGDGGNDVNMLLEANIGVGIAGKEGLQAARAADYAIARFKFLSRLVLVHGRYSYYRTSFIAQYCFYKSMIIAFNQIFFALVSGFSGSTLFNSYALACYNSIFTALPCVGFVLDKDVTESSLLRIPQIYQYSQNGYYMNARTMLLWFLRAVYQAVVIYIVCFGVYGTRFASVLSGRPMDYWAIGLVPYSAVLTIQMVTMALETNYWTWINHVLIWGSYILYIVLSLAISSVPLIKSAGIENLYWTYINLFSDPIFYLTVILATVLAILPVAIVKTFTTNFYPTLVDDVRRMESKQRRHKFVSKKRKTTIEEQPLWASSSDDVSQSLIEEDDYNYTFTESRENKLSVIIEDEKLE